MSIDMSIHINTGRFPHVLLTVNRNRWWAGYYCLELGNQWPPFQWKLFGKEQQCIDCDRFFPELVEGRCEDCEADKYHRDMAEDMFYGRTMPLDCGWCGCTYQESMYAVKQWYRSGRKYNHLDWLCPTCKTAGEEDAVEDDGDDYWDYDYDDYGYEETTPLDGGVVLASCHLCHHIYTVDDQQLAYIHAQEFDPCTYAEQFTCGTCRQNLDAIDAATSAAWEESVNPLPAPIEGTVYICPTCAHMRPVTDEAYNPVIPGPTAPITPAPQYIL